MASLASDLPWFLASVPCLRSLGITVKLLNYRTVAKKTRRELLRQLVLFTPTFRKKTYKRHDLKCKNSTVANNTQIHKLKVSKSRTTCDKSLTSKQSFEFRSQLQRLFFFKIEEKITNILLLGIFVCFDNFRNISCIIANQRSQRKIPATVCKISELFYKSSRYYAVRQAPELNLRSVFFKRKTVLLFFAKNILNFQVFIIVEIYLQVSLFETGFSDFFLT